MIFLITVSALTIFAVHIKVTFHRLQVTYTLLLTSVSFKWVINRSLPTISYMTSLDKYAMFSIVYLVSCCIWHSIIGSNLLPGDVNKQVYYDQWALIVFAGLFIILHIMLVFWYLIAYSHVRRIENEEKYFLSKHKIFKI